MGEMSFSEMPFYRSAIFQGRQQEMARLERLWKEGAAGAVICGMMGEGATLLAVQFAYRVLEHPAEKVGFHTWDPDISSPEGGGVKLSGRRGTAREWQMLLLDHLVDVGEAQRMYRAWLGAQWPFLVVTTPRDSVAQIWEGLERIELISLAPSEGGAFLRRMVGEEFLSEEVAQVLSEKVEGHMAALTVLGHRLWRLHMVAEETAWRWARMTLEDLFRDPGLTRDGWCDAPTPVPQSLARAVGKVLNQVGEETRKHIVAGHPLSAMPEQARAKARDFFLVGGMGDNGIRPLIVACARVRT